ncbi:hypothetical protein, partial [Chroococcidiopsis sp [FACHB-1243]]|uniref:hypothetical protein n=1 Tax=Chroococcidiopsis sp. [FACHB-1243] TaxID=2692781 RepID=UPI001A7E45D6
LVGAFKLYSFLGSVALSSARLSACLSSGALLIYLISTKSVNPFGKKILTFSQIPFPHGFELE